MHQFYRLITSFLTLVIVFLSSGALLTAQTDTTRCTDAGCHAVLLKPDHVHAPVKDDCAICHASNGGTHPAGPGWEYPLALSVPKLCRQCHDAPLQHMSMHAPFVEGNCLACHTSHSSRTPALLIAGTVGELCATCHDLETDAKTSVHAPVRNHDCVACHDPHQSAVTALLKDNPLTLCAGCHPNIGIQAGAAHPHPPVRSDCRTCHMGHASSEKHLLKTRVADLCKTCHAGVGTSMQGALSSHAPVLEKQSCLSCHTPHGSGNNHLLTTSMPELCYRCHGDQPQRSPNSIMVDLKKKIRTSKYIHAPVADDCDGCHTAHASPNASLLRLPYPQGMYTTPKESSFALCFDCHESSLLRHADTTTETAFRNGAKNLHFVHVMKEKAMRCSGCHDVHASDTGHLLASTIQFGKWEMRLNVTLNPEGGSCSPGCHVSKSYQRDVRP